MADIWRIILDYCGTKHNITAKAQGWGWVFLVQTIDFHSLLVAVVSGEMFTRFYIHFSAFFTDTSLIRPQQWLRRHTWKTILRMMNKIIYFIIWIWRLFTLQWLWRIITHTVSSEPINFSVFSVYGGQTAWIQYSILNLKHREKNYLHCLSLIASVLTYWYLFDFSLLCNMMTTM